MPKGLYLPDGSYRPLEADALTSAYATRQAAGALTELEGWLDLLPDPDPVLRRRGDDAAVLAELTADDQVTTAILSRKNRVLNCPHFAFRAGSADGEPATAQAEDLYRRFAQNLERCNLRGIISSILDAPFYGFVPLEILWGRGADWPKNVSQKLENSASEMGSSGRKRPVSCCMQPRSKACSMAAA